MEIEVYEKCVCSAEFKMSDSSGTYIHTGGACDDNGDKYVIQRELRNFRKHHEACRQIHQKAEDNRRGRHMGTSITKPCLPGQVP